MAFSFRAVYDFPNSLLCVARFAPQSVFIRVSKLRFGVALGPNEDLHGVWDAFPMYFFFISELRPYLPELSAISLRNSYIELVLHSKGRLYGFPNWF